MYFEKLSFITKFKDKKINSNYFAMGHLLVDDNISLESINLSHAEIIFSAIEKNRVFLRPWLPFINYTQSKDDTVSFIKSVNQKPININEVYEIWYKTTFAGLIGFKDTDQTNHKTELGYWVTKDMQGKGLVTKSVLKLSEFAFKKLNINRIQIKVATGNKKSSAIPKKLGFHFEGIERSGEKHGTKYFDLEVYSFLRSDWMKSL